MGAKYLESVLDREGVEHRRNGRSVHIIEVYLCVYLFGIAGDVIARVLLCKDNLTDAASVVS